jgi:hypothetical protein
VCCIQEVRAQNHTQSGSFPRLRRLRRKELPAVLNIDKFTSGNNPRYALVRIVADKDLHYAALRYWIPTPTRADLPHDPLRFGFEGYSISQRLSDPFSLKWT